MPRYPGAPYFGSGLSRKGGESRLRELPGPGVAVGEYGRLPQRGGWGAAMASVEREPHDPDSTGTVESEPGVCTRWGGWSRVSNVVLLPPLAVSALRACICAGPGGSGRPPTHQVPCLRGVAMLGASSVHSARESRGLGLSSGLRLWAAEQENTGQPQAGCSASCRRSPARSLLWSEYPPTPWPR